MSAWETVPDAADETDPDDWAEYMADVYHELLHDHRNRRFHDRDGFFAELAGSPQCLALGHTYDADRSALTGNDEYLPAEEHPLSWDGGNICAGTSYGGACSYCEGDCSMPDLPSLWSLPGVTGRTVVPNDRPDRHPDWGHKTEEAWKAARTEFGISSSHPLPLPALPVPPGTVAVLRLPIPVDGLVSLKLALVEAYGPGLVVRTDAGIDGWMVVARKDARDV